MEDDDEEGADGQRSIMKEEDDTNVKVLSLLRISPWERGFLRAHAPTHLICSCPTNAS